MNKYNIGDEVWFKHNHHNDTPLQGIVYLIVGEGTKIDYSINTKYGTTYYNIYEECIFKTKQELIDSL